MVVRMRSTRSHTGNRRSHHALTQLAFVTCEKCGSPKMRHRVCDNCGTYKGRVVRDVYAKIAKREKKAKEKAKANA
ncbi:50S ribosomal protein L32 [Candidatus Parcubacteria bacterium]|nr:50S ribosomal protein L32 [Candidatus Parcubacteria bacterium]